MAVELGDIIGQIGSGVYRLVKGKDVDLTEADAMASDLADADLILIDDGAAGTQASTKKSALSRFWTYILGKLSAVTDVSSYSWVLAEDNLVSDSDTKVPTQGSVKAYVDAQVAGSGDMSSFTVSATTDTTPTTITNGEDLFFADGTRINCETTADGTVTISTTATTNQTDAYLLARANHTGTQTAATISDFDTEVSNNASVTANTAKVSADGLVTTHSDVTDAGSGAIITTAERTKLNGIEASADVTDAANVAAAGAVMESDFTANGQLVIGGTSGAAIATLTQGSNVTITNGDGTITIAANDTNTTYTAGDGLDLAGTEFSADLKANGGLVIETTELAVDLGATAITGTLAVSDGGTGATSLTSDGVLTGNGTSAIQAEDKVKVVSGVLNVLGKIASSPGGIIFHEASDNGSATTGLYSQSSLAASNSVTLPSGNGTIALTSDVPTNADDLGDWSAIPPADGDIVQYYNGEYFPAQIGAGNGISVSSVAPSTQGDPATEVSVGANQTTIQTVYNSILKIGTSSTDDYIDFSPTNSIDLVVNNGALTVNFGAGSIDFNGADLGAVNVLEVADKVGDTANNDYISFATDGEISLVTNNSARLTASDTGVSAANINVGSELNSKKNIFEKTGNTDFTYQGDVVKIGTGSTTQGELCYYKSDGTWGAADADAAATSGGCLLAIALGTDPDSDGMLLRGMFTLDHDPGAIADELYVSTTAGDITNTAPSGNGDVVRVVGYCLDSSNGQIWFDPSSDWIEVSA